MPGQTYARVAGFYNGIAAVKVRMQSTSALESPLANRSGDDPRFGQRSNPRAHRRV